MCEDKERLQALLNQYTTLVEPSAGGSGFPHSLPHSHIHSHIHSHNSVYNQLQPPHSHIHSHSSISSCPTYNNYTLGNNAGSDFPHVCVPSNLGSKSSFASNASLTPQLISKFRSGSSDTGTDLLNACRICQLPEDIDDLLISPCRCSGSLKYVHYKCLLKWIKVSTGKTNSIPKCELCRYLYVRHKKFKFHSWQLPRISSRDKCLHLVFLVTLILMVACAVATVMCFLSDNGQISQAKSHLSAEEVVTLTCGVTFFICFFLAMTVEIKARHTVYSLFLEFITQNTEWQIEAYDRSRDPTCPTPRTLGT